MQRQRSSRHVIGAATVILAVGVGVASFALPPQAGSQQKPPAAGGQPEKADLDELEDAPEKFIGKTVVVEGEVDRVLGPHLFTIDERNWKDLERELPVVVPDPFAAVVRSDAPVRVTGVVQKVPIAEVERRRGFFGDEKIRAEIAEEPVLVANEITTIAPSVVSLRVRTDQPVGTAGGANVITDVNQLAGAADNNLVGRRVDLKNVRVTSPSDVGFWIQAGNERLFVMPVQSMPLKDGQMVALQGVVLQLPEAMRAKVNAPGERIYIYAERVAPQ
jgi:uncharacterized protein YdeI (BOF family)